MSIIVVGDLSVDYTIFAPYFPRRDEKMTATRSVVSPGGMGANVAKGLSRLGSPVRLVAAVGDDEHGEVALKRLAEQNLDLRYVETLQNTDTFQCVIFVGPDGEKSLIRVPTAAYLPSVSSLTENAFGGVSHLHVTFGSGELAKASIEFAQTLGMTVSMDLEAEDIPDSIDSLREVLDTVDLLFLSSNTRQVLSERSGDSISVKGQKVITTRGSNGSMFEDDESFLEESGYQVQAIDTTGAGDAFAAAFLSSYITRSRNASESLQFANAVAAFSTLAEGAQGCLPTYEEVSRFVADFEQ